MSTAGSRSKRFVADDSDSRGGKAIWLWISLGLAALAVLGFLIAWMAGWIRFGTDPRITEIRAMQEEMQAKFSGGPANEAQAKEMVAAIGTMMQKMSDLPPNLRRDAMSGGGFMRGGMQSGMQNYFAAPPEDRKKILDKQIDQMELMAKAFASAGGMRGGPPRGGGEDGRNNWRKQMIDRTSPGQRAQFNEYFRAMEERRKERGMGSMPWGPRG